MHYYYDLLVNLDDTLWEFYEWEKEDAIIPVKKIPFVRISDASLQKILKYEVQFESEEVKKYQHKALVKNEENNPSFLLLSSTKNSLVIEIDEKGKIISRSKLLIEDENNVNELASSLKKTEFTLSIGKKIPVRHEFRQALAEKKIIQIELNTLVKKKDENKSAYLYYEWFGELETDFTNQIKKCKQELAKPYTLKIHDIASIIKISYKEQL